MSSDTINELRQARRDARRTWEIVRRLARDLLRTSLPTMAAALSFRTLFSLVPILVLGMVVLGSFATPDQVHEAITKMLQFSGLDEIVIDAPAAESQDGGGAISVDDWINQLVQRVQDVNFRTIGLLGILLLAYAAIAMFVEVERAFNKIFNAESGRSWAKRVTVYWTLLTLGSIGLLASFYVGERITSLVADMGVGGYILKFVAFLVTAGITSLVLVLAYTGVPTARVTFRAAFAGAGFAAILWEACKWGFTLYLGYSTKYITFYGSIALLLFFLLWVYLTWLLVLFGLQVAYAFQHFDRFRDAAGRDVDAEAQRDATLIDPVRFVRIAIAAARAFAKGESLDAADAAEAAEVSPGLAAAMLDRLAQAGVVRPHTAGDDEESTWALARPAEAIQIADLVALGPRPESVADGGPGVARLVAARIDAAKGLTLADLAGPQTAN